MHGQHMQNVAAQSSMDRVRAHCRSSLPCRLTNMRQKPRCNSVSDGDHGCMARVLKARCCQHYQCVQCIKECWPHGCMAQAFHAGWI